MFTSTTQHLKPKSRMCCSSYFKSVLNMDNNTGIHRLDFKIHRFKVTLSVLLVVRAPNTSFMTRGLESICSLNRKTAFQSPQEGATFGSRLPTSQNLTAVLKMAAQHKLLCS